MRKTISFIFAKKQWLGHFLKKPISWLAKRFWWPYIALIAVFISWFLAGMGIPVPIERTLDQFGAYGDSYGRITSLFTALGFGGLVITLILQQRQIRSQEQDAEHSRKKDEKDRYETVLFRLLEIYRQTLSEVRVGETTGRDVLRKALDRVDAGIVEEGVNGLPRDLKAKWDSGSLKEIDRERIDYLHFRNFKIVAAELHMQTRLVDTFQVLLEHILIGAPDDLLIEAYRDLAFAQITFIEGRYFFLAALAHPSRMRLRELMARTCFLDRISRSQIHQLHRDMYKEYWGYTLEQRKFPANFPMEQERIRRAMHAHKSTGGIPKNTYTPVGARQMRNTTKDD